MALTLTTKARNAACDAIVDLVDEGTGAGKIKIRDSGNTILVTFTLSDPGFGAASSGAAAAASVPKQAAASATGTAANFIATDSDDETMFSGTVTATGGGGDVTIDNASIASGQTCNLTSLTITVPAS
jgi:hypothetical protein